MLPRTKNNMCIREIPSRRIDYFFREGLRQSGADRQGGRTNPPGWRRAAPFLSYVLGGCGGGGRAPDLVRCFSLG